MIMTQHLRLALRIRRRHLVVVFLLPLQSLSSSLLCRFGCLFHRLLRPYACRLDVLRRHRGLCRPLVVGCCSLGVVLRVVIDAVTDR